MRCRRKLYYSMGSTYTVLTITSSNQTFSGQLLHVSVQNRIWQKVRLGHWNRSQLGDSADLEASASGLPAKKTSLKTRCMVEIYECQVKLDFARHSVCTVYQVIESTDISTCSRCSGKGVGLPSKLFKPPIFTHKVVYVCLVGLSVYLDGYTCKSFHDTCVHVVTSPGNKVLAKFR